MLNLNAVNINNFDFSVVDIASTISMVEMKTYYK